MIRGYENPVTPGASERVMHPRLRNPGLVDRLQLPNQVPI